jgi:hypothetical protein
VKIQDVGLGVVVPDRCLVVQLQDALLKSGKIRKLSVQGILNVQLTWVQCYKTYFVHNLWIFVIN